MKLAGKCAVVTGAGSGIGRAIAERFAREGAFVAVADLRPEAAQAVAEGIEAKGGRALAVCCDVSDGDAVVSMFRHVREALGPVDILVNNAGGAIVGGAYQRFEESTRAFLDKILGVNLMGTLFCSREAVGDMIARRGGRIINLSSIRGMYGDAANVFYGTAKGGILSFTYSLAMDLGKCGITVNAISPGAIASRPGPAAMKTFLGRPGTCEEVASLALFLASEEAAFITGENIVIDGGRTHAALGDGVPSPDRDSQ